MAPVEAIFENGVLRPIQPLSLPEGSRVRLLIAPAKSEPVAPAENPPARRPLIGSARGLFKLSPDFDAPLDDFKEYM